MTLTDMDVDAGAAAKSAKSIKSAARKPPRIQKRHRKAKNNITFPKHPAITAKAKKGKSKR